MKIKFPILIQYKKQYDLFMEYLDKIGVMWKSGVKPSEFKPAEFPQYPIYILYWEKHGSDKKCLTYVYKDEAEWLDDNYKEHEVEFED